MKACVADAGLVLAVAFLRVAAVSQAVRDVACFPLPAALTLAVHGASRVPYTTLATARAVVGTCIQPGRKETEREKNLG